MQEAGIMTVCRSKAWSSKIVTSAWWVWAHQVSKKAPSGEYLPTCAFMITGKKNYLPPVTLEFGFGIMFRLDDSSIARHSNDRRDRLGVDDDETLSLMSEAFDKYGVQFDSLELSESQSTIEMSDPTNSLLHSSIPEEDQDDMPDETEDGKADNDKDEDSEDNIAVSDDITASAAAQDGGIGFNLQRKQAQKLESIKESVPKNDPNDVKLQPNQSLEKKRGGNKKKNRKHVSDEDEEDIAILSMTSKRQGTASNSNKSTAKDKSNSMLVLRDEDVSDEDSNDESNPEPNSRIYSASSAGVLGGVHEKNEATVEYEDSSDEDLSVKDLLAMLELGKKNALVSKGKEKKALKSNKKSKKNKDEGKSNETSSSNGVKSKTVLELSQSNPKEEKQRQKESNSLKETAIIKENQRKLSLQSQLSSTTQRMLFRLVQEKILTLQSIQIKASQSIPSQEIVIIPSPPETSSSSVISDDLKDLFLTNVIIDISLNELEALQSFSEEEMIQILETFHRNYLVKPVANKNALLAGIMRKHAVSKNQSINAANSSIKSDENTTTAKYEEKDDSNEKDHEIGKTKDTDV